MRLNMNPSKIFLTLALLIPNLSQAKILFYMMIQIVLFLKDIKVLMNLDNL